MKLKYEKIIRRDDGSRVRIEIEIRNDHRTIEYITAVFTCEKRKRTWKPTYDRDGYNYRGLGMDGRKNFAYDSQFEAISNEELLAAKTEYWESLRPSLAR